MCETLKVLLYTTFKIVPSLCSHLFKPWLVLLRRLQKNGIYRSESQASSLSKDNGKTLFPQNVIWKNRWKISYKKRMNKIIENVGTPLIVSISSFFITIYYNYYLVKLPVNYISKLFNTIHALCLNYKREPCQKEWLSISILIRPYEEDVFSKKSVFYELFRFISGNWKKCAYYFKEYCLFPPVLSFSKIENVNSDEICEYLLLSKITLSIADLSERSVEKLKTCVQYSHEEIMEKNVYISRHYITCYPIENYALRSLFFGVFNLRIGDDFVSTDPLNCKIAGHSNEGFRRSEAEIKTNLPEIAKDNYCIPNDYYLYFSPFIQSNVYFLTVQYLHPKMTETIEIKIPESYYIVGNQLYSSIFVLRCLQYQSKRFVFDENYTLEILDNNITIFQLKSNEYISIEKDEYKISGV